MKYSSGINPDCATRDGLAGGLAGRGNRERDRAAGSRISYPERRTKEKRVGERGERGEVEMRAEGSRKA